jgi:hypothetical protein
LRCIFTESSHPAGRWQDRLFKRQQKPKMCTNARLPWWLKTCTVMSAHNLVIPGSASCTRGLLNHSVYWRLTNSSQCKGVPAVNSPTIAICTPWKPGSLCTHLCGSLHPKCSSMVADCSDQPPEITFLRKAYVEPSSCQGIRDPEGQRGHETAANPSGFLGSY